MSHGRTCSKMVFQHKHACVPDNGCLTKPQEVLKHYGIAEEPTSHRSRGSRESTPTETNTLFIELPEEVQNVVRPYLDSKFQLQGGTLLAPGIIIRPDMTFRRWLTSWMRQLTGLHASGPHFA